MDSVLYVNVYNDGYKKGHEDGENETIKQFFEWLSDNLWKYIDDYLACNDVIEKMEKDFRKLIKKKKNERKTRSRRKGTVQRGC